MRICGINNNNTNTTTTNNNNNKNNIGSNLIGTLLQGRFTLAGIKLSDFDAIRIMHLKK